MGANIRRIRKERGLTLEQVCAAMGDTDTGNLSRIERGEQAYTPQKLTQLANVLQVRRSRLFEEADESLITPPEGAAPVGDVPDVRIPVFGVAASMGLGIVAYPEQETVVGALRLSEQWVRQNVTCSSPSNLQVISAFGDSMEPTFRDGDMVIFDRGFTTLRLDAVYVVTLNGELFIKRIQRRPDKRIVMKSDNAHYDPYVVPDEEMPTFRVIGKVVFAWNGKKM